MISPVPAFSEKNVPVVFASDGNYIPYAAVAIKSIIYNASNNWNYDILLLTDRETIRREQELQSLAKGHNNISIRMVDMHDFSNIALKFHLSTHVTSAAYYRLFITEICSHYDKIIYLDCDILCTSDIAQLYDIPLGFNLVAGAHDEGIRCLSHRWLDEACDYIKSLGMENPKECFNSGVLVMNLKLMRKENILQFFLNVAEKNRKYWHDQTVLNVCCQGRVLFVPEQWNYTSHMYTDYFIPTVLRERAERMNAAKDYYIIHYANPNKPWKMMNSSLDTEWWKMAFQTNFMKEIQAKTLLPYRVKLHIKSWIKLSALLLISCCIRTRKIKRALANQMDAMGQAAKAVDNWKIFWSNLSH